MAAELPRPGVEVIQVFRSTSPTVITPTLVPCVVGVCKQIVDVTETSASGSSVLNSDALVPLPATFLAKAGVGSPPVYAGLDGLVFAFSVNHAPVITVTLSGSSLSPSQVVAQIRTALGAAGNTTATADVVGTTQWRLRTYGANEFQIIEIDATTDPTVAAAFATAIGRTYVGASFYTQYGVKISTAAFPDPRSNLTNLAIDAASVRAFLYFGGAGGNLVEIKRDRSFLRNGLAAAAVRTGTGDLSIGGTITALDTQTLILTINGGSPLTVTFAAPADAAAVVTQVNAVIGSVATATLSGNFLRITTTKIGPDASILIGAGTANTNLGLTATTTTGATAVQTVDDGNYDTVTPLIKLVGSTLTAAGTAAVLTGTVVIPVGGVPDGETLVLCDGATNPQTVTFSGATTRALVLSQINAVMSASAGGLITATMTGGFFLVLTNSVLGTESAILVHAGTANTTLGLTEGITEGTAYPAKPGDELYVDGVYYALITQVAPGGAVDTVKIDRQVSFNTSIGLSYYIIAKNLPAASRPTPDLVVDSSGNVSIKHALIRDTQGFAWPTFKAQIYLSYSAVRLDVTSQATNPALLRFNDTTALESQLSPVNVSNPLALGVYFALLNAPGTQVTALGVDAITDSAPYGTVEAFTRAASFLEAYEVYAVAPLTHDVSVGQVYATHASVMSSPANKGERVVLFNPAQPTARIDTLVASGVTGNSTGSSNVFDTGVSNLPALLLAAGIDPTGAFLVSDGLLLDVGDGMYYSVVSIAGGVVTVKTSGFLSEENDDAYYATTTLPGNIIDGAFAVRIRGAALTLTDGTVDKDSLAVTYQGMASSYLNRRFWQVVAPQAAATIGGLEQLVEGFYLCAAAAGMIGKNPPQQSFTNYPMTGFTRVIGTNGYMTERQLNVVAAGGNYIIVQDETGAPLISRMALTTDMTSIETRTDSITKVVDFSAKFLRRGLKNFIGRFNITQGFLDSLGHVIQGLLGFLAEAGVLIGSHLNNIVQDQDAPDTVLIDITLDVPFPCNYIRLTLVI